MCVILFSLAFFRWFIIAQFHSSCQLFFKKIFRFFLSRFAGAPKYNICYFIFTPRKESIRAHWQNFHILFHFWNFKPIYNLRYFNPKRKERPRRSVIDHPPVFLHDRAVNRRRVLKRGLLVIDSRKSLESVGDYAVNLNFVHGISSLVRLLSCYTQIIHRIPVTVNPFSRKK